MSGGKPGVKHGLIPGLGIPSVGNTFRDGLVQERDCFASAKIGVLCNGAASAKEAGSIQWTRGPANVSKQGLCNQGEPFAEGDRSLFFDEAANLREATRDIDAVVTVTDLSVKFGQSFFISKQSGGTKIHPLLEPLCVDGGHYSLHEGASVGAS